MTGKPARQRFLLHAAALSTVAAFGWLLTLIVTWARIAGQAGSPRPDNWDTLERVADAVEAGLLPAALVFALSPAVWYAAHRQMRVALLYPAVLAIVCAAWMTHSLKTWTSAPPARAAATNPSALCWPRGVPPGPDVPVAYWLNPGDRVTIQSMPDEVFASMARDPGQAAQIRSWLGKSVIINGVSADGGLSFTPAAGGWPPGVPRFCLRRADFVRLPTNLDEVRPRPARSPDPRP